MLLKCHICALVQTFPRPKPHGFKGRMKSVCWVNSHPSWRGCIRGVPAGVERDVLLTVSRFCSILSPFPWTVHTSERLTQSELMD